MTEYVELDTHDILAALSKAALSKTGRETDGMSSCTISGFHLVDGKPRKAIVRIERQPLPVYEASVEIENEDILGLYNTSGSDAQVRFFDAEGVMTAMHLVPPWSHLNLVRPVDGRVRIAARWEGYGGGALRVSLAANTSARERAAIAAREQGFVNYLMPPTSHLIDLIPAKEKS